jgi:flagellin
MSRINTNVSSLLAQRVLNTQNRGLTTSLERLSTGLKINRGADNPAGLIASESLRSEKAAITAAIANAQRAEQVVNIAEGGLQEINNLLLEIQSLIGESANEAGLSVEEKEANQLQIDSILDTIDRIANSTSFNGQKLLNGTYDYTVANQGNGLDNITINSARINETGTPVNVTVDILESATTGTLFLSTANITSGDANNEGSITIEITGAKGSQQFTFADGATPADIQTAINNFSDVTGVSASEINATSRLTLVGTEYGADNFARVRVIDGSEDPEGNVVYELDADTGEVDTGSAAGDLRGDGTDIKLTINCNAASTSNGLTARAVFNGFDIAVTIDGNDDVNRDATSTTFQITGGGANFNLSPEIGASGKASLGIGSVNVESLGKTGNSLASLRFGASSNVVSGNLNTAQEVVDAAIKQVSSLRGRLGAFQKNTLGATINNLGVALENTSAAESIIRETDFAQETANLTRQQIMSQAATQALAIANAQPQAVLALLG